MWEGVFIDVVWYGFDSIEEVIHGGSLSKRASIALNRVIPRTSNKVNIVPRTSF